METLIKSLAIAVISVLFVSSSVLAGETGKNSRQNEAMLQLIEDNAVAEANDELLEGAAKVHGLLSLIEANAADPAESQVLIPAAKAIAGLNEIIKENTLLEVNEKMILSKAVQQRVELSQLIEENAAADNNHSVIGHKVDMSAFIQLMEQNASDSK